MLRRGHQRERGFRHIEVMKEGKKDASVVKINAEFSVPWEGAKTARDRQRKKKAAGSAKEQGKEEHQQGN